MHNVAFSKWGDFSFFLFFFIIISHLSYAQKSVTGHVLDIEGYSIPGVSVLEQGTSHGTITDLDGNYQIPVDSNATLIFSFVGYGTQFHIVGTQSVIDVELTIDAQLIDEIVVTGYTVDSRRKIPGSVSTINSRDLEIAPSGNIEQQLQGRVPGVTVISNGQPGTTSQVRVRGYGSLGGNAPLYIVDGVPVSSVDFLNPGDIESTTVLKDASSASIYGARAAGGVIVYTTKKGKKENGKMSITYDGMLGYTHPESGRPTMNPMNQADWTWTAIRNAATLAGQDPVFNHPQYGSGQTPILPDYLLVGNESGIVGSIDIEEQRNLYNIDNAVGPIYQVVKANKEGTNWYDAMTRNALINRHHLGISGGGDGSQYYVSLAMQDQEGILVNQKFSRYSFRVNTEFDVLPFLTVGENMQSTYRSTRILDGGAGGIGSAGDQTFITQAHRSSPLLPIYDEFGGWAGSAVPGLGIFGNSFADLSNQQDDRNFSAQAFGNVYMELRPMDGLVLRSSFGGQYIDQNIRIYGKEGYYNAGQSLGFYRQSSRYEARWTLTNTANYRNTFGKHDLDILIGQEALDQGVGYDISGAGIDPFSQNIDFVDLSTVSSRIVDGSHFNGVRFSSYFTRFNYTFDDRYIASIIVRRDGSSRFGKENRFGTFPAFSAAWRISSEPFMQGVGFIEDMKIRAGYGIMGNSNNVNPNNQYSLFGTSLDASSYDINGTNSSAIPGFYRSRIGNPNAKWEQAVTTNFGIDILLFNGKLDFGIEIWKKETDNFLFQLPVTVQSGFFADVPFINAGKMLNKGLDFIVTLKGRANQVKYQVSVNGGFLDNEIVELSPGIENLPNISVNNRGISQVLNQVGQPLSTFYGFDVEGLFKDQAEVDAAATQEGAAPGRFRFRDINNDGVITQEDRTNLGNPIADFTGGLAFKLSYRNIELETYSYVSLGNEIYNISKETTDFYNSEGSAISQRVKDSWTFENTTGDIPIFENTSNFSTNTQSSSYFVEDGSYFRLQNITLSYLLSPTILNKWGLERMRVYASINNAFTITNYSGLDPSVGGAFDTNFGIDRGNYPITRNVTFGINLSF